MGRSPAEVQVSWPIIGIPRAYEPLVFIYGEFRLHDFVVVPFMKLLV